ncbi:MAG: protein kinase, partial [Rhodobacterales bacterium]|nr:protein kinase [Rhodobacterales bacterium]
MALRFRDEARILGLIRHRAVVGVDSLAELESGWAVVMEYVDGVDITSVVRYGLPPARVVVSIIEEVASALHAAWTTVSDVTGKPLRLVHRDIKPANVRLTAQGEVKVLDFGVARAEFESREANTQAMRFGSLRYMAPESF